MWTGEGWIRTRRQLGVAGLVVLFVSELIFHVPVPIGLYGIVTALLGLGELADALASLRVGGSK